MAEGALERPQKKIGLGLWQNFRQCPSARPPPSSPTQPLSAYTLRKNTASISTGDSGRNRRHVPGRSKKCARSIFTGRWWPSAGALTKILPKAQANFFWGRSNAPSAIGAVHGPPDVRKKKVGPARLWAPLPERA